MKYKISQHLLILYSLTEPSDLMWLRLNIAIFMCSEKKGSLDGLGVI